MVFQTINSITAFEVTETQTTIFTVFASSSSQTRATIQLTGALLPFSYISPQIGSASAWNASPLPTRPALDFTSVLTTIFDTNGFPVATATIIAPSSTATNGTGASNCSSWNCWSPSQQAGTAVGITIFIIAVMGLIWWGLCCNPQRRGRGRTRGEDMEMARNDSPSPRRVYQRESYGMVGEREGPRTPFRRTRSRRRSRSRSLSSSGSASTDSNYAAPLRSGRRHRAAPRMKNRPPPYPPRTVSLASMQGVDRGRTEDLYGGRRLAARNPTPPAGTSIKDFAIPAAAGVAAATLGEAAVSRRRPSLTLDREPPIFERSVSPGYRGVPVARGLGRSQSQYFDENHYENRARRRNSIENTRRARSLSQPRRSRSSRSKGKDKYDVGMSDKWLALLPMALSWVDQFAEPKGGWEKYHSKGKKSEQQLENNVHQLFNTRSRSPRQRPTPSYQDSPDRSRSVDAAYAQLRPPRARAISEERTREWQANQAVQNPVQERQYQNQGREPPSSNHIPEDQSGNVSGASVNMVGRDRSRSKKSFRIRRKPVPGQARDAHSREVSGSMGPGPGIERPRTRRREDEDRIVPEFGEVSSAAPRTSRSLRGRVTRQSLKAPSSVIPADESERPPTSLQKIRSLRRRVTRRDASKRSESAEYEGVADTKREEARVEKESPQQESDRQKGAKEKSRSEDRNLLQENSAPKKDHESSVLANQGEIPVAKEMEEVPRTAGTKPFPEWQWQIPRPTAEMTPPDSND